MPVKFKEAELDNGLKIIAEVNPEAHTGAVGFFVKVGSRDEYEKVMGVSHFLEHMMFKGTARRTADQVNQDFDKIGASFNASTSQEVTNYYAHVLPEYIPDALDVLSDIMRPSLRQEDFDMEKQVIIEEIGMYMDRPFWVAYEQAMDMYFKDHPLGYRILGTNESIKAMQRDDMQAYFDHRYSPDNMVVSLAGKIDFDACVEYLKGRCGEWERTSAVRDHGKPVGSKGDELIKDEKVNRHYMVSISDGPAAQDSRRYAASIAAQVIGDSEGSHLYWELIDPGIADEAEISYQPFDQTGVFVAYASCNPKVANEVQERMYKVLTNAKDNIKEDEVQRAVSKIAMSLTLQNERPAGRMMSLGSKWLYFGEYIPFEEELDRITSVTVEDVKALLASYRFDERLMVNLTGK